MSNSHKGSFLSLKNEIVPVDNNTTALFHFDITPNEVLHGIQPISNTSSFRTIEGKYGGGIAIDESTSTLIPNPTINSYPTRGNGWGSYQTNQYNNDQYFSIGTIISVSGNMVTYSGGTQLRTYDVVRPQSGGGGVTAGTDYFVKAISPTQFTLHQYNSLQDGSLGFSVYSYMENDIRIPISANGFPNMWWGAPHLPHSDTLKELHYGDFSSYGQPHDYLRIYTNFRTDGVVGGVAYGVFPNVVSGNQYTVSFYQRAVTPESIGKSVRFETWTNGNYWIQNSFTLTPDWQRVSFVGSTVTSGSTNFYWMPPFDVVWDLSEIQIEQKGFATSFTTGSRSTGILTYDSSNIINPTQGTISLWYLPQYPSSVVTSQIYSPKLIQVGNYYSNSSFTIWNFNNNLNVYVRGLNASGWSGYISIANGIIYGSYAMYTVSWSGTQWKVYVNGVLKATFTTTANLGTISGNIMYVGGDGGDGGGGAGKACNGIIDELRIDNIQRTDEEIMSWYISNQPFYPKGIYRLAY